MTMMSPFKPVRIAAISLGALLLASCGTSDTAPTGQVLATVNGEEITSADLNLELGGLRADNAAMQKQLEAAALQTIINRVILASAAKEQEVDSTPVAATALRKAEQLAMIELLSKKFQDAVRAPAREDVEQYVQEHPDSFAERKIFVVDQIIVPSPPQSLVKELEPLDTITEVKAALGKYQLPVQSTVGVIDALEIDPKAAAQIAALAPGAVFMIPVGSTLRINVIRQTDVSPLSGEAAIAVATKQLKERQTQQQTVDAMGQILAKGRATVKYNAAYAPKPQKPPVKGGAAPKQPAPAEE